LNSGVLSGNKVTSIKHISSVEQQSLMKKLNQKIIKWRKRKTDNRGKVQRYCCKSCSVLC